MFYRLYVALLVLLTPFIYFYLFWRMLKGKENPKRLMERFGKPSVKRPDGRLVWIHGASVGETLSALPLIEHMQKADKSLRFLITSGTTTSATLLKTRLPKGVIHQFVPIDLPWTTKRFLDHWKPRLALRVDSEIWPVAIKQIHDRKIPHIMVNARLSDRSFKKFMSMKSVRDFLFSRITACFAKSEKEVGYFKKLGIKEVYQMDNLKLSALLPVPDKNKLAALKKEMGDRPFWLAASTGKGLDGAAEEPFVIEAHKKLKKEKPNLLTLVALRHPGRADEVIALLKKAGLTWAQRSKGEKPGKDTDIYLFDTMGEMALLYTLADIVFSGRSIVRWGGNTPVEPAGMKCALIVGPHTLNFQELYTDFEKAHALLRVKTGDDLFKAVKTLFDDKKKRDLLINNAYKYVKDKQKTAERLSKNVMPFLKPTAWLIADNRTGTINQLRGIAKYLDGFNVIEKKIEYSWKIKLPNFMHALVGVPHTPESGGVFEDNAPDLILSGGRRTASTAVWLKKKCPNAILAHILNPNLSWNHFDYILLPQHDKSSSRKHTKILPYVGATHRFNTKMLVD
ncbi:MAG: mitochondrial fission ELM1 family protein, partial [Alphaproteobacteria bacterium]|nr:mitochondrial fission ELM1 family protein [Alphaproteobacteria bacterium]